jgi:hypothetical protein
MSSKKKEVVTPPVMPPVAVPDVTAPVENPSDLQPSIPAGFAQGSPQIADASSVENADSTPVVDAPAASPGEAEKKSDAANAESQLPPCGDSNLESPSTPAPVCGEGLSPAVERETFLDALPQLRKQLWEECYKLNSGGSAGSLLVQKFKSVDVGLIELEKFLRANKYYG